MGVNTVPECFLFQYSNYFGFSLIGFQDQVPYASSCLSWTFQEDFCSQETNGVPIDAILYYWRFCFNIIGLLKVIMTYKQKMGIEGLVD